MPDPHADHNAIVEWLSSWKAVLSAGLISMGGGIWKGSHTLADNKRRIGALEEEVGEMKDLLGELHDTTIEANGRFALIEQQLRQTNELIGRISKAKCPLINGSHNRENGGDAA